MNDDIKEVYIPEHPTTDPLSMVHYKSARNSYRCACIHAAHPTQNAVRVMGSLTDQGPIPIAVVNEPCTLDFLFCMVQ